MHAARSRLLRLCTRLAFHACAAAVVVLALAPDPSSAVDSGSDKLNHAIAFLVLGLLGHANWPAGGARLVLALSLLGLAIEVAQAFTPHRSAEIADWGCDLAGLALARGALHAGAWVRSRR